MATRYNRRPILLTPGRLHEGIGCFLEPGQAADLDPAERARMAQALATAGAGGGLPADLAAAAAAIGAALADRAPVMEALRERLGVDGRELAHLVARVANLVPALDPLARWV